MEYTWEEVRNHLGISSTHSLKYRIPHRISGKGRKKFLYMAENLDEFDIYMKKKSKSQKMSHCTGKDGWQQLARSIIAFAVVESDRPFAVGGTPVDATLSAREFLSEESEWTDILEGLAEWPGFFKAYKAHGVAR